MTTFLYICLAATAAFVILLVITKILDRQLESGKLGYSFEEANSPFITFMMLTLILLVVAVLCWIAYYILWISIGGPSQVHFAVVFVLSMVAIALSIALFAVDYTKRRIENDDSRFGLYDRLYRAGVVIIAVLCVIDALLIPIVISILSGSYEVTV